MCLRKSSGLEQSPGSTTLHTVSNSVGLHLHSWRTSGQQVEKTTRRLLRLGNRRHLHSSSGQHTAHQTRICVPPSRLQMNWSSWREMILLGFAVENTNLS